MNAVDISIRRTALESDIPRVREIMASSGFFEKVVDEFDCAESELRAAVCGEKGAETFLFAEVGGKTVGFVSYERQACCEALYYLDWIAVDNSVRGMGIGKVLVGEMLSDAWANGAQKVLLQTSGRSQYLPTRRFYEAMGFSRECEIPDYYSPGEPSVFYSIYNPDFKIPAEGKSCG